MKHSLVAAAFLLCIAAPSGAVPPVEEGRPKPVMAAPAVGYSCVPSPKPGLVRVVMAPVPPGFKCPPGQTLFLVTKQLQDRVGAAPVTEVGAPAPGPVDPILSGPPGTTHQEVRAKKKKTQKQCAPVDGGLFCCYNGGYSNCGLE